MIWQTVKINECASSPCKNGGHCYDLYDKYYCYCASGFTVIDRKDTMHSKFWSQRYSV